MYRDLVRLIIRTANVPIPSGNDAKVRNELIQLFSDMRDRQLFPEADIAHAVDWLRTTPIETIRKVASGT